MTHNYSFKSMVKKYVNSSVVLIACTILALAIANSRFRDGFFGFWDQEVCLSIGEFNVFSHNGHYVVAVSEERDGRIAILDPAYWPDKYEEEGRKGLVEVKNGVMAVCDMQVLMNDTDTISPRFYLFWRK